MKAKVYLKKNPKRYVREHKYLWRLKLDIDYGEIEILKIKEYWTDGLHEEFKEYEYNMHDVDHILIEN